MKDIFNDQSKPQAEGVLVPSVRDKDGTGYDIFSLLLKERIIVVTGQVEMTMAANIIAQLKYLEHLDSTAPIKMLVNSPGGSVHAGMAILDIMREIKCPIETIGNGMQASMGSILLAGGDARVMTKNSMLLVHQIMGGAANGTQHSDFASENANMALLHERLKNVYVEHTGLNHKFWDVVGERDSWLTTEQAIKIGYIQREVKDEKPNGAYVSESIRQKEGLAAEIEQVTKAHIAKMSSDDVLKVINNGNAQGGTFAGLRAELIVRLSEFPEFWTEKKKLEVAAKVAAAAPANQNVPAEKPKAPKKSVGNAPKA